MGPPALERLSYRAAEHAAAVEVAPAVERTRRRACHQEGVGGRKRRCGKSSRHVAAPADALREQEVGAKHRGASELCTWPSTFAMQLCSAGYRVFVTSATPPQSLTT